MKKSVIQHIKVETQNLPEVPSKAEDSEYSSILQFLRGVVIGILVGSSIIVPIAVILSKNQSPTATPTETTTVTTAIRTITIPTTTTATITTTRFLNYTTITGPNDTIVGIFNTIVGSSSNWMIGNYGAAENPPKAIDNNINTKYLNFGDNLGLGDVFGLNSGFYLTPLIGSSVATGVVFNTANDSPDRDPTMITLEGSNDATSELPSGHSWTLIYAGSSGISATIDPGRNTKCQLQVFNNSIAYKSYRLLITDKRGYGNSVQYSELAILGYV